jgi:hypothetical protein
MIEYRKAKTSDDLLVDCRDDQVMLGHKDSLDDGGILCLKRQEFDSLDEQDIIARYNAHIDWLLDGIANDRPIEIAHGNPQIKWSKECQQWTPAGDVLRCEVTWHPPGPGGAVAIKIDDQLLSGEEFLKVIEVHEGFGMRIEFMHPNRLTNRPEPIVQVKRRKKSC